MMPEAALRNVRRGFDADMLGLYATGGGLGNNGEVKQKVFGLLLLAALGLGAQTPKARLVREPAAGRFLVAQAGLPDLNFHNTVILLVKYDDEGAMGVVVNRPTKVTVSKVFEDMVGSLMRADEPVFVGGPVARSGVVALLRTPEAPGESEYVTEDVYMITAIEEMEDAVASDAKPAEFRVFAGYSGWGAGQLERELLIDSWHVFEGEASLAFDPDPGTLWERLIKLTETRIAMAAGTTKGIRWQIQ
jgi:putative transcriptional regulator